MTDRVRSYLNREIGLKADALVLVALSGGADSTALLLILKELGYRVKALHCNFHLRGKESDRDQAFVEELCKQNDVPLSVRHFETEAYAKRRGISIEMAARDLRYEWFRQKQADASSAPNGQWSMLNAQCVIAVAHHRDDQAETLLLNLVRGTGLRGLAAMHPIHDGIIRPLLCCTRSEIEAYCSENDLDYVTDSTNLSDDYTRNKLRHRVMPVLRELNPSVGESIGRTSAIMREADEYLTQISEKELKSAKVPYGWSCERLLQCEPIILKYAVKNILEKAAAPVDFQHTALIIEAMHSNGAVDFGGGYTASCAQGILRIVPKLLSTDDFCVPILEYMKKHGTRIKILDGLLFEIAPPLDLSSEKINNLLLLFEKMGN